MRKPKSSFYIYTLFCFAAFTAFGVYSIYYNPQSSDLASTAEEQVIKKLQKVNDSLASMNSAGDLTCACQFGNEPNMLSFEKPEDCGADRNYLQDMLAAFKKADPKGVFSGGRDYSQTANILPRKCVLYIMRNFWRDRARTAEEKREADIEFNRTAEPDKKRTVKDLKDYKKDAYLFSKCDKDPTGTPERYGHKACVTEDYVNLVYNSLIDVADCLDVPAKFMAPKLSNESGLHVNAFGGLNDGGIGQFTDQALVDVAQNYESFKGRIVNSTKDSCKRLNSMPGVVPSSSKEIVAADANRCHVITTPPNPLRSFVYYGIFYHATKRNAKNAFNKTVDGKDPNFKSAETLMKEAGIGSFDQEAIKEMLFVMAYNSGPGRPASIYREWLKYRLTTLKKYPITKADFTMDYWPARAHLNAKLGQDRVQAMDKKGKPLTLAEYMFAFKDSVYIAAVKAQAKDLNKKLGDGTCTQDKFLDF